MANWVVVENDVVIEKHAELPAAWRNISGFTHLINNPARLLALGWRQLNVVPAPDFDDDTDIISGVNYVFEANNTVTQTSIITSIPENVRPTFAQLKIRFMGIIRAKRNKLIQETDWTQLPDVILLRGTVWRDTWRTYRQELRNIPNTYAFPDTTVKPPLVVWPIVPNLT